MPHPSRKIVGPMLNRNPPATVEEVSAALITPVGLRAPRCVVDEWLSVARHLNHQSSTAERIGGQFREDQKRRRRGMATFKVAVPKPSRLQRMARAITRMFRK